MSFHATRYHDISCGHRVYGHEGKCNNLHGHNYRITFTVVAENGLDAVGRVMDFSVIKAKLCVWLEENWDHKMLLWEKDPFLSWVYWDTPLDVLDPTVVKLPFNPTAENIAEHLVTVVAPRELAGTGCKLISAEVEETRKCAAEYHLEGS